MIIYAVIQLWRWKSVTYVLFETAIQSWIDLRPLVPETRFLKPLYRVSQ